MLIYVHSFGPSLSGPSLSRAVNLHHSGFKQSVRNKSAISEHSESTQTQKPHREHSEHQNNTVNTVGAFKYCVLFHFLGQ